jgi:nucleotidyltransferase AbiEii toxin of type IV toxin-antitoxin system
MPLTTFQRELLAVLAPVRGSEGYLAGGAALHFSPNSTRHSHDLDFFHDSSERVAKAYAADSVTLEEAGYALQLVFSQPGFIRVIVSKAEATTQIDWAHDSSWRFMPLVEDGLGGLLLHPVDLAVNKALALAGRDEARDLVDVLYVQAHILTLGPLIWAAVGKDPGFSPESLLNHLRRSGRFQPDEIGRLDLTQPFDLREEKERWLAALSAAQIFVEERPAEELGCLYYSATSQRFEEPSAGSSLAEQGLVPHFGTPGGIVPRPSDSPFGGA